ncbi:hypothetical protein [Butyrivibrio proteoclasticus]|uniref:hypothetical protein n=1 Tax=Butyrivibrio proteoclasticus TaxID=43305 RepID=UPI0006840FA1|nr:hypothetical protein [Butyrivibrio proteoclasticus]
MDFMNAETLKHRLKVLYMLDHAVMPDAEEYLRIVHHSQNEAFEEYEVDNGAGDKLMVRFYDFGVIVKGFDHENELNQIGSDEWDDSFFDRMFEGAPDAFISELSEKDHDTTTFCLWYLNETGKWYQNEVEDNDGGKSFLTGFLFESAEELLDWAKYYYGKSFNEAVVKKLYETEQLPEEPLINN